MTLFLFFTALLAILAIALAASALWQRSRALALALAFGLPLAAAGIYHLKGNPAALAPAATAPAAAVAAEPSSLEEAVAQLEQKVAGNPNDFDGTVLLARSYMAMEKFDQARDAYARAVKLKPEETDLTVEYAEALLRSSSDHRFPPEAVAMLEAAIAKNPDNQRALFFLGTYQMQENKPADAVATWERLLPMVDADTSRELRKQIDMARRAAGMPPLPPESSAPVATTSATDGTLDIDVQIDPAVAASAKPGDVLFVFARSVAGSGPPFAAKRIVLGQLPMRVQLSDADSPMPAAKLSTQSSVLVMARLSKSGDVKAAPGDIEADPQPASVGDGKPVVLVLSRPVP